MQLITKALSLLRFIQGRHLRAGGISPLIFQQQNLLEKNSKEVIFLGLCPPNFSTGKIY